MSTSALDLALEYLERGFRSVPVPAGRKNPVLDKWQELRLDKPDLPKHFSNGNNIGILLGVTSGGLIDIDLDCSEAVTLAPHFFPATKMQWGHERRPSTHWGYRATGTIPATTRLQFGRETLVELRSTGGHTLVAPSTHPDGDAYVWNGTLDPTDLDGDELVKSLLRLGAASLLTRHWPAPPQYGEHGCRHDAANALAGMLYRLGWTDTEVERFVAVVADAARDEEWKLRAKAALATAKKIAAGGKATGAPSLTKLLGHDVVDRVQEWLGASRVVEGAIATGLPEVLVPGAHITDQGTMFEIGADDFVRSSVLALPPGGIYRRAKLVGEIHGDLGKRAFEVAKDARLRIVVDEHLRLVRWVRPQGGRGRSVKKYMPCTSDLAALIREEVSTSTSVRELKLLTSYPVATGVEFGPVVPGYNAACGTFYDPPEACRNIVPIRDMNRAREILRDLVVDFPFKTEADRQNFFGLLLTPIVWPAMPATNVPMHLVHSSLERTGKTKLASEVVGRIILGQSVPTQPLTKDEELDKRITSLLARGGTMIVIDNINTTHAQLESSVLAMLLTSRSYTGRILGRSEEVTFQSPMLTVIATANNPRMNGELAKRIIPIALQPSTDHPEARTDFRHPDLAAHLASARVDVLAALLGIVEEWNATGRPLHPRPLGGFEEWSRVVGGMLSVAGFTAWGTNLAEWQRRSDPEGEDLRKFVTEWASRWPDRKKTAHELFDLAVELGVFPQVMLAKEGRGQMTAFGMRVLAGKRDTPVGSWIIRATGSGASSLYYLEKSRA
jgi:hypothetical protein